MSTFTDETDEKCDVGCDAAVDSITAHYDADARHLREAAAACDATAAKVREAKALHGRARHDRLDEICRELIAYRAIRLLGGKR